MTLKCEGEWQMMTSSLLDPFIVFIHSLTIVLSGFLNLSLRINTWLFLPFKSSIFFEPIQHPAQKP